MPTGSFTSRVFVVQRAPSLFNGSEPRPQYILRGLALLLKEIHRSCFCQFSSTSRSILIGQLSTFALHCTWCRVVFRPASSSASFSCIFLTASTALIAMAMELPPLPVPVSDFLGHVNKHPKTQNGVAEAVEPFKVFENKLREVYAQHPDHPAATKNHLVPVFRNESMTIRARDLTRESSAEKDKYLLPLPEDARRKDGSPATVESLKTFKTNFNLFSESSLVDLDWNNVVAAGSSVITSLLPVDAPHNESKVGITILVINQIPDTFLACSQKLLPRRSCASVRCRPFPVWPQRRSSHRENQTDRDQDPRQYSV